MISISRISLQAFHFLLGSSSVRLPDCRICIEFCFMETISRFLEGYRKECGNDDRRIRVREELFNTENNKGIGVTSRIVFFVFTMLASIVLINLMIGLAVNDIQSLEKEVGYINFETESESSHIIQHGYSLNC